jgi:hypothetical protein
MTERYYYYYYSIRISCAVQAGGSCNYARDANALQRSSGCTGQEWCSLGVAMLLAHVAPVQLEVERTN